ncbi:MAG TPA: hypothetical protein VFA09_13985 [Ktedonobacteraceae bacterium]|nr:hypothetical protein [Ktedonobacteraceae bacterium]
MRDLSPGMLFVPEKWQEEDWMLSEWKAILTNDLDALKQLVGKDETTRVQYKLKVQEIGQHCYQAEETLTDKELARLKKALGLTDQEWHAFKAKVHSEQA